MDSVKPVIRPKTKCDLVEEAIMSMIAKGHYSVGDKLPTENEFCEMFSVSRVTVREAVKRLNTLGIVSIQQGDGTYVKLVSADSVVKPMISSMVLQNLSVEGIYDARLFVEIGNARLAARNRNDSDIAEIKQLSDEMDKSLLNYNPVEFSDLDNRFHEAIAKAAGNAVLLSTYDNLKYLLRHYIEKTNFSFKTAEMSQGHHRQIFQFIHEGNEYLTGISMEQHLVHAKASLISALNNETER